MTFLEREPLEKYNEKSNYPPLSMKDFGSAWTL